MVNHDWLIGVLKELLFVFAVLTSLGALANGQFIAAAACGSIALLLYHERKIQRWLRKRFPSFR